MSAIICGNSIKYIKLKNMPIKYKTGKKSHSLIKNRTQKRRCQEFLVELMLINSISSQVTVIDTDGENMLLCLKTLRIVLSMRYNLHTTTNSSPHKANCASTGMLYAVLTHHWSCQWRAGINFIMPSLSLNALVGFHQGVSV